jgi:hypothetical protein
MPALVAGAMRRTDATLAAIAAKAEKEATYHLRHAGEWLIRLGDGHGGEPRPHGRVARPPLALHRRDVRRPRTTTRP